MNFTIKKHLLVLFICLGAYTAKAQLGYEYAQYDIGVAGSINSVYGDAQTIVKTKAIHFNFNYNVSPFVNYVFEVQTGDLRGGDVNSSTGRQFTNNFTAALLRAQVQGGEIMDYSNSGLKNALKNLYLSTGVGYIVNHMTEIYRGPGDVGLDNSNAIMIPARVGYEFKVFNKYDQPSFKVDIGYQYNFVLGDNLDGIAAGVLKDKYSQISIGFKFAIGGITSYAKQIHY